MNTTTVLGIILFVLMAVIGGVQGIKSFCSLVLNFLTFFIMLILIAAKIDPIKVTFVCSIIISYFTLFFLNGLNKKTLSSIIAVTAVILIVMCGTYTLSENANIQGFSYIQKESIAYIPTYVQFNFSKLVVCEILIGLLGAIIDVAISISSSMEEIYANNNELEFSSLFKSGMQIGKDILGTMTNTLFFAYISSFLTLMIYFSELKYSMSSILNEKLFCSEVFQALCCGIGIILIIPITAFVSAKILTFRQEKIKLQQQ